jgi:molecular chaperone DnaK
VSFDIDSNGIVHVSATDLGTGKQQQVRVVSNSGLSEKEIQKMVADAQTHLADDKKKKSMAELINSADGLIYTTEKSLEEYAQLLTEKDREEIRQDLDGLKSILGSTDPQKLKEAIQRLEGSAYRIADKIYLETQKTG